MASFDTLGQVFDRIAIVQRAEWWRDLERAGADAVDGMTACAIIQRKRLAALFGRLNGEGRCHQDQPDINLAQCKLQHSHQSSVADKV
jgi:hypothetical protein